MTYHRTFLSALFLAAAVVLAACDVLDVEPEQSLDVEQVFSSPGAASAAVTAMYSALQEGGAFGGISLMAADFSADNARFAGSFTTYQNIRDYVVLATNASVEQIWEDNYEAINRANYVLANIDGVPTLDQSLIDQYRGEALFVRAIAHHNLVRYFGQPYVAGQANNQPGVPLVLEPTLEAGEHIELPRSSVEEVYGQIIADLQEAEGLVPDQYSSAANTRGRATLGAVRGYLARVYLYQGAWQNAADYAGLVLDSPLYELSATPQEPFGTKNTAEQVFSIQMSTNDNIGVNDALSSFYLPSDLGGRGDITVFPELLELYGEDDLRRTELIYEYPDGSGTFWSAKYTGASNEDNVPIIRVAGMILTRAEALAELGNTDEALALLNRIRSRASVEEYTDADFADADELVDLILQERRLELAFEGHRRFDFMRRRQGIEAEFINDVVPPDNPQYIFPIPARELDVNPNLEPNPGY